MAYKTVWAWEKRLRSQGRHSWREAKHPGGPRKIDAQQRKRLRELLLKGALAHGYATDLWTLKRVAEVIEKAFGEEYTESGVWHVLRDLGLSAQVPVPPGPGTGRGVHPPQEGCLVAEVPEGGPTHPGHPPVPGRELCSIGAPCATDLVDRGKEA